MQATPLQQLPPDKASSEPGAVGGGSAKASIYALAVDAAGSVLASGVTDGVIRLVDARSGAKVAKLKVAGRGGGSWGMGGQRRQACAGVCVHHMQGCVCTTCRGVCMQQERQASGACWPWAHRATGSARRQWAQAATGVARN